MPARLLSSRPCFRKCVARVHAAAHAKATTPNIAAAANTYTGHPSALSPTPLMKSGVGKMLRGKLGGCAKATEVTKSTKQKLK